MLYSLLFKLVFSKMDPELAHHIGMAVIRFLGFTKLSKFFRQNQLENSWSAIGLKFAGPFGLAAGFDKNGIAIRALGDLGFSHVEVGTVTRFAQPGNPKPRLFRLIHDRALINRMGFNNDGADAVASRLSKLRKKGGKLPVIGVNIGKSKVTEIGEAEADYAYSAKILSPYADYLAVNVSSPNTPGLRSLQAVEQLKPILVAVKRESAGKPVMVKIAPDLSDEDVLEIAALVRELGLAGVIATNTTVSRSGLITDAITVGEMGEGGLSGPVLKERALQILDLLKKNLAANQIIVSVGGIETARDVAERLNAGASLVQGYTGFVYFGPLWARRLNREFLALS